MKKIICDVCGKEIEDAHLVIPKHFWWVVPSFKIGNKYDVCRECWQETRKLLKEKNKE